MKRNCAGSRATALDWIQIEVAPKTPSDPLAASANRMTAIEHARKVGERPIPAVHSGRRLPFDSRCQSRRRAVRLSEWLGMSLDKGT